MLYAMIKKKLGDFFLDVEFQAEDETLALLGASGCGKSMTLKCIAGVETPDEGQIILNNRVLFDSKKKINLLPQDRRVGLLFQNYALFPNMTLYKNIEIGILKDTPNKAEITNEKIQDFSLTGLENNYPHQLSGGQQQRVALARMLVNKPEIIMLDEPFSALDEHLRWQMEQGLIYILKEHRGPTLYVSHNKDEVYRVCDRIAILDYGKIESIGDKHNIFNNPQTLNTALLTGCKNISKVKRIDDYNVYAIDWGFKLTSKGKIGDNIKYIGMHPSSINFSPNTEGENTFKLKIVDIIKNRFSTILVLSKDSNIDINPNSIIYMEHSRSDLNSGLTAGATVHIELNKDSLFLIYN